MTVSHLPEVTLDQLKAKGEGLEALKELVSFEERVAPFCALSQRTVRVIVDETPYRVYPRIQLLLALEYNAFIERMCSYGNTAAARMAANRHGAGLHYTFTVWADGECYRLTEPLTEKLFETAELPVPARVPPAVEAEPDDLFESLNPYDLFANRVRS